MNIQVINVKGVGQVHCHTDKHVGMVGGYDVQEITNDYGQHYFKASWTCTHMFGSEIEAAPLFGYGATREIAIERLEKEMKEFNDAMWV